MGTKTTKDKYGTYPVKRIYLADIISLIMAFFTALFIRYHDNDFYTWADIYDGLYVILIIAMCLIQTIIFLIYDARRRSVFEQDPFENLMSVIGSRTLMIVLTIFYLYATQRGELSSRFVLAAVYILSMIFGLIFRMIIRTVYLRSAGDRHAVILPADIRYPYPDEEKLHELMPSFETGEVLIHAAGASDGELKSCMDICEAAGLRVYVTPSLEDTDIGSGIVSDIGDYSGIPVSVRNKRFGIFGVNYVVSRAEEAVLHVIRHIDKIRGSYICFSNVHTLVMAREKKTYRDVLNGAALTFADGTPIARMQQRSGLIGAERVAGPDFMERMFKRTERTELKHYFYGSSEETLEALALNLKTKYPDMTVAGMYSPPYRELTPEEEAEDIKRINDSGADLIWIGLGAPKQEEWMAAHSGQVGGVMLGVGAGFDFHAGTIKRAPVWVQKIGLEWLYRLLQDPKRLIKRYLVTNVKFYWYRLCSLIERR